MFVKWRPLAVLATVLASGPALAGLKADVVPILNQRCVMCHLPGATQAGLDLFTNPWASLVNVKSTQSESLLVVPGEPEQSYFYLKLVGRHREAGGQGEPMPIPPAVLTPQELEAIRNWIAQGAPDD
jgi:mono/diheme cytochrome c family protein